MKRFGAILLAVMLLFGMAGVPAEAAGMKQIKSKEIGIVFDNSGSMYSRGNLAWCRATYAMEIFASMMNNGDSLKIYPMNPIEIDGQTYTYDSPFAMKGGDDTSVIERIYTPEVGDTPVETIPAAFNGIKGSSADEKWLVVLTDGANFYKDLVELNANDSVEVVNEALNEAAREVNVLYLGIGNPVMPTYDGTSPYTTGAYKASGSDEILTKLTEVSNAIFGRDILPGNGKDISFDVDMSKLIAFVQGSDLENVKLVNSSGIGMSPVGKTATPKYSEMGYSSKFEVDRSLSGVLVTFEDLERGDYKLEFDGNAAKIDIYYEPDAELMAYLTDGVGNVMTASSNFYPGEYFLNYGLVDKNGQPINSPLLGSTKYVMEYSLNGQTQTPIENSSAGQIPITLAEGDDLDVALTATYLSGYTIRKEGADFDWLPLHIDAFPAEALIGRLTGGKEKYAQSEIESGVYDAAFIYGGIPVEGADLDKLSMDISFSDPAFGAEVVKGDNGYQIALKLNGEAKDVSKGKYSMEVTPHYENEFGVVIDGDPMKAEFKVAEESHKFTMKVKAEQSYYQISNIENEKPIVVQLKEDGKDLTPEQLQEALASMKVSVTDKKGNTIPYTLSADEAESSVNITLKKSEGDEKLVRGKYTVKAETIVSDEVGEKTSVDGKETIELGILPLWMLWLIRFLFIALILLLLWLWFNMKVLPKKVIIEKTSFSVDGEPVTGGATCEYSGGGSKKGSLSLRSPRVAGNSSAKCTMTFDVEAVDPRRVPSKNRKMKIVGVSATPSGKVTRISAGALNMTADEDGKLYQRGKKVGDPIDAKFATMNQAQMSASALDPNDPDGGTVDLNMRLTVRFK